MSSTPRRAVSLGLTESTESPLASGLSAFDARLGGIPRGRITEILGPASAGKTALMLSALSRALERDESAASSRPGLAALVDLSGTIFPDLAGAERELLVVRPRSVEEAARALDALLQSGAFDVIALEMSGLPHPLPEAVAVRSARLAHEWGTCLIACGTAPVFGASCALRVQLSPSAAGQGPHALIVKSRQGGIGEDIVLSELGRAPRRVA